MKKLLALLLFTAFAIVVKGQSGLTHYNTDPNSFKKYKIDAAIGGAIPFTSQTNGTLIITVEPHYRLSDANELGLRIQEAFLRQVNTGAIGGFSNSPMDSYCFTADHYFSNNMFRPFISAGVGAFRQGQVVNQAFASQTINAQVHPGIFPRIGFEIGLLRVDTEYNLMGNNSNGSNSGYMTVNAGFFLGGGGHDRR
jgi:hypothetical protein